MSRSMSIQWQRSVAMVMGHIIIRERGDIPDLGSHQDHVHVQGLC